jgi:hypothetical protein
MVDFRTKLFTLAGFATVFAGMAYGQATCSTASANAVFIRAEGNTEQVADTNITCTVAASATPVSAGQTASITVYLSPSVNITSATLGSGSSAKSETTAGITTTLPPVTAFSASTQGSVSGNSVTFSNIALPAEAANATFNLTITNIKVAASTVATGTGVPTGISETIFMSGTGIVPTVISPAPTVAYVTNGLASVKANKAGANPICTQTSALTNNNDGLSPTPNANPDGINFSVAFNEGFADAFKIQGSNTTNVNLGSEFTNHTETGWGYAANSTTNTATSGTRIKIIFNNIPANVSIYVPLTVSNAGGTLTLTASETGAFSAVTGSNANGAPGASADNKPGNSSAALLSVSSGSATAIYEATTATTSGVGNYSVPVYLEASPGAVTAPSGAVTATVSFAPIGATSNVPNFINGSSTTTVNGSTFSACATTLLFPFVTNVAGFETGMAIANTSADLLGVKNGAPVDSVAAQAGTCLLTFFSNATASSNPAAYTSPSVAAGTTWASTLTAVTGGTPGNISGGYVIANCNFLYAHGYAFIVYNVGQASAMAEGYLALELTTPRTAPPNVETLNN